MVGYMYVLQRRFSSPSLNKRQHSFPHPQGITVDSVSRPLIPYSWYPVNAEITAVFRLPDSHVAL